MKFVVYRDEIYESPTSVQPALVVADAKASTEQQQEYFQDTQLGFDFENATMMDMTNTEVNMDNEDLTADGFSVDGECDTNKYNNKISNISSNPSPQNDIGNQKQNREQEIINRFPIKLTDPIFSSYLNMAMLGSMISTQAQLDRYLLDFNLNHEQYKHLTATKRIKNFIHFLIKIQSSPSGQKAHQARLRASGFILNVPVVTSAKPKQTKDLSRFTDVPHIQAVSNQEDQPFVVTAEMLNSMEGY